MELGLELGLDLGTASAQACFSSSSPPLVLTLFLSETMCFGLQDNPWLQSDASAVQRFTVSFVTSWSGAGGISKIC